MIMEQKIMTPIGERKVNRFIIDLFHEMPTAPAKKCNLKNVVWTEKEGKLVTIVKGVS